MACVLGLKPSLVKAFYGWKVPYPSHSIASNLIYLKGREAHEKQRKGLAPALRCRIFYRQSQSRSILLSHHSVRNLTPIFLETSTKASSLRFQVF
jgi:hypothetical protein